MTLAAYVISPAILAWMAPTLVGLVGAVVISWASGSAEFGLAFRRAKLLMIPEEREPPAIIGATMAQQTLAAHDLPEVEDGLITVVEDRRVRELHERVALSTPLRPRGKPELEPVMAAAKIAEAVSLEEVLIWLTPKERMAVLAHQPLIAALVKLKEAPEARPAIIATPEPQLAE
jgi:membrane glycosyltransferase